MCREVLKAQRRQGLGQGYITGSSQVALVVKNPPANAGDIRDVSLSPGLGRSPGRGYGNPLQYSFLENPMDGAAWWAAVRRVTESDMPGLNPRVPDASLGALAGRGGPSLCNGS